MSTNSKDLLAQIGLTQEELQDRVVNRIVGIVMYSHSADDEGREHVLESRFRQQIQDHATAAIDKAVTAIGDKFIVPAMKEFVETFTIQETNKWGDKIGQKLTFTEYLVKRAEEYSQEMRSPKVPIGRYENGHMRVETDYMYAEGTKDRLQKVIDDYNVSHYYALISELKTPFQFILGDKRGVIVKKTDNAALVLLSDGTLGEIRPLDEKKNIYRNSDLFPILASEAECGYGTDIACVFETMLGKINTQISAAHKDAWPEMYLGGDHIGLTKEQLRDILRAEDSEYKAYCEQNRSF